LSKPGVSKCERGESGNKNDFGGSTTMASPGGLKIRKNADFFCDSTNPRARLIEDRWENTPPPKVRQTSTNPSPNAEFGQFWLFTLIQ
jgi:hypothetical protein